MTHNARHGDLMLEADYVKLEVGGGGGVDGGAQCLTETSPCCSDAAGKWWCLFRWWAKLGLVALFVGALLAVFLKWIGPFVMQKVRFSSSLGAYFSLRPHVLGFFGRLMHA